jgi:hypothetical protein
LATPRLMIQLAPVASVRATARLTVAGLLDLILRRRSWSAWSSSCARPRTTSPVGY